MKKPWYLSKTLWVQVLALVGLAIQTKTGWVVDPAIQGGLLALVNLVLRAVTGQGLATSAPKGE